MQSMWKSNCDIFGQNGTKRMLKLLTMAAIMVCAASCHTSKKTGLRAYAVVETNKDADNGKQTDRNDRKTEQTPIKIDNRLSEHTLALLNEAEKWLGTKYKYGGDTKNGVDCSGLTMRVFEDALGIKLPRNSGKQQEYCSKIKKDELSEGDLVFFSTNNRNAVGHVGLYIGKGQMIHSSTSKGVIISSLNEDYYLRTYHSSGRVEQYWAMVDQNAQMIARTELPETEKEGNTNQTDDNVIASAQVNVAKKKDQTEKVIASAKVNVEKKENQVTVSGKINAGKNDKSKEASKTLAVVKLSKTTPPPATKASLEEARRKALEKIIDQKADSISGEIID